jgi:hypothetical protein
MQKYLKNLSFDEILNMLKILGYIFFVIFILFLVMKNEEQEVSRSALSVIQFGKQCAYNIIKEDFNGLHKVLDSSDPFILEIKEQGNVTNSQIKKILEIQDKEVVPYLKDHALLNSIDRICLQYFETRGPYYFLIFGYCEYPDILIRTPMKSRSVLTALLIKGQSVKDGKAYKDVYWLYDFYNSVTFEDYLDWILENGESYSKKEFGKKLREDVSRDKDLDIFMNNEAQAIHDWWVDERKVRIEEIEMRGAESNKLFDKVLYEK